MSRSVRQVARRQALAAQAKRRSERAEAERRCSALGVEVMVALAEKDAAVSRYETAAAEALLQLMKDEQASINEACGWCGDLAVGEVKRLMRLADEGQS